MLSLVSHDDTGKRLMRFAWLYSLSSTAYLAGITSFKEQTELTSLPIPPRKHKIEEHTTRAGCFLDRSPNTLHRTTSLA